MKRLLLFLLFIYVAGSLSGQAEKKIVILHTNDLHSRLNGFTPEADYTPLVTGNDNTRGGFARIAAILRNEKENNQGTTLIVDAGDFLMGTLFHSMEDGDNDGVPEIDRKYSVSVPTFFEDNR